MFAEVLKIEKHPSKLVERGNFYYIFFKNEKGSYKTCVYEKFRNFKNWREVISKGIGIKLDNLVLRGRDLVDADSMPVIKDLT